MNQINKARKRKSYVLYELDTEVSLSIITNPGTEVQLRRGGRVAMMFPSNIYLIQFDFPDSNFLREKNTIVFEMEYIPSLSVAVDYYSPFYYFRLNSEHSNLFIIDFKINRNENSMFSKDPPGKPLENETLELTLFFKFICEKYIKLYRRYIELLDLQSSELILKESIKELNDLLEIFKSTNENNLLSSPRMIIDYLNSLDEYISNNLNYMNDIPIIFIFCICMMGVFPYDYFINKDYNIKNSSVLLNIACQINIDFYADILKTHSLKNFLLDGMYVIINLNIKEGSGTWLNLIRQKLHGKIFDQVTFYIRLNEIIRRSQIPIKSQDYFSEAKTFLLNELSSFSEVNNPLLKFKNVIKSVAALSSNKENLIKIVLELIEQNDFDTEKVIILREEIKRKNWENDQRDYYHFWIEKLNRYHRNDENCKLKDEMQTLIFELSHVPQYIFTLFKTFNYENIESNLVQRAVNCLIEFSHEDFIYTLQEFRIMSESLQKQLVDSNFFEKMKVSLKKILLPFDNKTKEVLRECLLSTELFPNGSFDTVKDYIKSKPKVEDLLFVVNDLLLPQRKFNENSFKEIFITVKNYVINLSNDFQVVSVIFSNCIKSIFLKENSENIEDVQFKTFISWEFWRSLSQLYSPEVFLCLCQYFSQENKILEFDFTIEKSFIEYSKTIFPITFSDHSSLDKINHILNSLSKNSEDNKIELVSNNRSTEFIILNLLDILKKIDDPGKSVKLFLFENPNKDHFLFKLLRSKGDYLSFKGHEYMVKLKSLIEENLNLLRQDSLIISEYIGLSKMSEVNKEAIIALFNLVITEINENEIRELIDDKIRILEEKMKTLILFEHFFHLYSSKIENSDFQLLFLKETRDSFKSIPLKELKIKNDLLEIRNEVININDWSETVIFRNIFETEFAPVLKIKQDKEKKEKRPVVPDKNINIKTSEEMKKIVEDNTQKIPLSIFIGVTQSCINKVKTAIIKLLQNPNFSDLTLSTAMQYFKGIEYVNRESQIIKEKVNLNEDHVNILENLLRTFYEITNFIKFSDIMIKLDSKYRFKESNIFVYDEFIKLIGNKASSFEKIYQSSSKLTNLRNSYLEKRDIESVLFELSEDKELIEFLLVTPEEDIRNMVDAVDEHGDSFIRVQTIRDLLIISSFLRSLSIKDFTSDKKNNPTEQELIDRIHNSLSSKSGLYGIDVLMNSCTKQILGIKHLHHELSNREEASKLKAKEICNQSTLIVDFNEIKKSYEIKLIYGKSNKKLNLREICDLRDRVLLLIYNEKDKGSNNVEEQIENTTSNLREVLSSLIKVVEIIEKILFLLNDIYINGYPNHFLKSTEFINGNLEPFQNFLEEITFINNEWNNDMKEAYEKYYPLTFFYGKQFWELEKVFLKKEDQADKTCNLPGYYLLKYANNNLNKENIISNYSNVEVLNPKERIFNLGELLSTVINVESYESKKIENIKKVNLNLKGNKFLFSAPSTLKLFSYLLSIHFSLENSLPESNQIFYCSKSTTFHELVAFLLRFVYCPIEKLFSILRVECLSFELQNFLVEQVNKLLKNKFLKAYLSIICCDINSFIYVQFSENPLIYFLRDFDILDDTLIKQNLENKNLNTFIVRSNETGAGKTFFIRSKKAENMEYVDFPILDSIELNKINERFYQLNNIEKQKLIHFTIIGNIDNFEMLDYILFKFIFIGSVENDIFVSFRNIEDPIYIEISNTFNDYVYNSISILPLLPEETFIVANENIKEIVISQSEREPINIVANYLHLLKENKLNDIDLSLDDMKVFTKEEILDLLNSYFIKDNKEITFRQVMIFISVLSDQLKKFSYCEYFKTTMIKYIKDPLLKDIRSKVLICLIKMTEEFTIRSIKSTRDTQNNTAITFKRTFSREDQLNIENRIDEINTLTNITSWSSSNHLLVIFHDDSQCITPVYREASKVSPEVKGLVESQRGKLEEYKKYCHLELLEKLLNIVNKSLMYDYLSTQTDYILTADNFLKMLLIIMRARCNLPIVIMGETGCGKTSLVRYLTTQIMQEPFITINFHAGIREEHIRAKMKEIINKAQTITKFNEKIWVFLDEINTCDCMGLITELICQKSLYGEKIPDNIIFIAACNPYKLRAGGIEVGLIKQRNITRLVYTVHPLPDSLIDYVWDYGSLTEHEEKLYIGNILAGISGEIRKLAIELVCRSQIFIRKCEDKYSVSLRDVSRFKLLHEWFFKMLTEKNEKKENKLQTSNLPVFTYVTGYTNIVIKFTGKLMVARKSLILSLLLCYYNRISKNQDRIDYKKLIAKVLTIAEKDLEEMINEEQRDIVTRMELPPAIAINKALLENVFTLLVCVINKIPLFICGKPGCSKSLSVQLVVSNLRGNDSPDPFFKKLPKILAVPYQGSESSTSEGIERIFEKANNVLKNDMDKSILPLIVFDEIGLAEISKNNPLKILHSLLEPEKAEIAFVGISNWRLDASKMNRAIFLARPDPDLNDLENTALSIFEYYNKEPRFDEKSIMKSLAKAYYDYKKELSESVNNDFHGTRDFYSLIKQVTKEFNKYKNNYNEVKFQIIKLSLHRNFGGLPYSSEKVLHYFTENMKLSHSDFSSIENQSVITLISENLMDHGESRYLLLFTNGDSASYILDNYLKMDLKDRVFMIGSEFEADKDKDEHSFKLLSDIILYMENGNSIILKNLDQIYGSLYDLFNQNFMIVGKKKNCRIALGSTNNPMCFVNNYFHCIVLVDIKNLNMMDPPFLNRFEKQLLTFESILTLQQKDLVNDLEKWITNLTSISNPSKEKENSNLLKSDLIITYNEEFCSSIVLKNYSKEKSSKEIIESCKKDILSLSTVSLIVYSVLSEMYMNSRDELYQAHKIYFDEQYHDSLYQYLSQFLGLEPNGKRVIVYTYSNILDEFNLENEIIHCNLNIAEIKSEKDFEQRFKMFLNSNNEYLFIKFDTFKEKSHIPLIKYKIDKLLGEYLKQNKEVRKNVIMMMYLSKSSNFSVSDRFKSREKLNEYSLDSHFLSNWDQIMIDCLSGGQIDSLKNLLDLSTLDIIMKTVDQKSIAELVFNLYLKFNYLPYNQNDTSLVKLYMTEIIHKIESDPDLFEIISRKCLKFLEGKELGDWKIKICCDKKILSKSLNTFSAIKLLVNEIIEEPLLKIVYHLETESSLYSYFNETKFSSNFRQIWKEIFESIDFESIYPYNSLQSMSVNPVFYLTFPFSKNDIYHLSLGLKEHIDKIYVLDNHFYSNSNSIDEENMLVYSNEIKVIKDIVKNSAFVSKKKSMQQQDLRSLELAYLNDVITYFLLTQLKKEFKWKSVLETITEKFVGFEFENIEFFFIFLWKNLNLLDSLFNTLNSFNSIFDVNFLENFFRKQSLYHLSLTSLNDITSRRFAELSSFTNIYNELAILLLSNLKNIKNIKNYGNILNVFISSLLNFSLELKVHPESMNLLLIINEYLKVLSVFFNNDIEECASRTKELLIDDTEVNLRNFSILPIILSNLDHVYENLKNSNKPSLMNHYKSSFISGKLSIFENVLTGQPTNELKVSIITNILKDEDLLKYSSMIFHKLFSSFKIDETLNSFEKSDELVDFLSKEIENLDYNSAIFTFFSDFFRKFFTYPCTNALITYLNQNFNNFLKYLEMVKQNSKFSQLQGFCGLKHYLELYGRYLVNSKVEKDMELNNKINNILDLQEQYNDLMRNYVLKSMSFELGGTSSSLVNVNFEEFGIKWVNNKLFEINDNSLGLEPNIPQFEKLNKEYSMFFVSLVNENNQENNAKLENLIISAQNKPELKFILIQFFVNKVYLSFTNKSFTKSFTYIHIKNIFENVGQTIKHNLGGPTYNFIDKLIKNFNNNSLLSLNPTIDSNRVGMMSLIMQFYNSVLSFPNLCTSKIFYKSNETELIDTFDHFDNLYLPGGFCDFHDENLLLMIKHINENYEIYGTQVGLYECSCGFLYTIGDCTRPYYLSSCPSCTSQIGGNSHILTGGSTCLINADNRGEPNRKEYVTTHLQKKLKYNSGFFGKMADEIGTQYCIRAISPVTFRFLNLFNNSIMYLLVECGVVNEKFLNKLIQIKEMKITAKEYLSKHINTDISKLNDIINSRDYYMFMTVIYDSFIILASDKYQFTLSVDREKFEVALQTKVIDRKMENIQEEIISYRSLFQTDKKMNYLSIIDERYSSEDLKTIHNSEFYRIFRLYRLGNWSDLTNEFQKKKLNKNYQFLKLLIEKFDEICSLTYLPVIIQFTNYMLAQCNYRLTRQEAKEKTIEELISANAIAQKLFREFAYVWSKIGYKATQYGCKALPPLDKIDASMPVSFILVDDRELGYGMYMSAILQYLGSIQNEVLEAIVYLIKENNNYQMWGNTDIHKYSIQKISPHEIIMYQTQEDFVSILTENFSKFYDIYNPEFGRGCTVDYNFEKIENELAFILLSNKKFLNYEDLLKIQYKYELLSIQGKHSNLLVDIKSKIEQTNLEGDELNIVSRYLERLDQQNVAYLHQVFSSIEIILFNMRYANNIDNIHLGVFCQKIQGSNKIVHFLKDSEPLNQIKISKILSLYELVEKQLFKYIVEYISPDYYKPIDQEIKSRIVSFLFKAENRENSYPLAEQLLNVVIRFIIRCLVASIEPKFPIKEYLVRPDFWDLNIRGDLIDQFYFDFPDEVFIFSTMSLLEILKEFISKKEERHNDTIKFNYDKNKYDSLRHENNKKNNKLN